MVEWAGLEIRSLSQDRGFESLSLLETKRSPFGDLFVSQKKGIEPSQRVRLTARERSERKKSVFLLKINLDKKNLVFYI